MRHPIKLIVRKSKVGKAGTAPISLQYCFNAEKRVVLNTGINIPFQYWNKKTGRLSKDLPQDYGNIPELENKLTDQLRKAEDMITYALKQSGTCPMKFLKNNFHLQANWKMEQMSDSAKSLNIYSNIDDYVRSKQSTVKRCTINVINAIISVALLRYKSNSVNWLLFCSLKYCN